MRPARALLTLATLIVLAAGVGCTRKKKSDALPPLTASAWRVELPVPGFAPASVALPLGSTAPRPIVVVLHGARDRAEWQCGTFRGLVGGRVFILCPAGVPLTKQGDLQGLGNFDDTASELRAALAALKRRFGAHVAASGVVLIGYGESAAMAADLARQDPKFFSRVALVNGPARSFTSTAAKVFGARGGKRVLFFCTDSACDTPAVERALQLTRAGVSAKAVRREVGPYLDPPFVEALRPDLTWLLEGDARFPAQASVGSAQKKANK